MSELVLYDAMCRAIEAAHAVDEVKDIRDKALALATYARLATDTENERRANEIRLRAERRAGELLRDMNMAKGAAQPGTNRGTTPSSGSTASATLSEIGISRDQSARWQRLAAVPQGEFESALADPDKMPSTAGIIAQPKPRNAVSSDALWLWGRLMDFERDGLIARDPADILLTMPPGMLDDVHRLAPKVARWLNQIGVLDAKRSEAAD